MSYINVVSLLKSTLESYKKYINFPVDYRYNEVKTDTSTHYTVVT